MIEFALAVILAAVAVARWRRRAVAAWPSELRRARLGYAERTFRAPAPPGVVAKVDRAYRTASGALVLVELKTRPAPRVYPADIIELSAQRLAAAADTGEPVADYAYVLTQSPDGRRSCWHRVRLLPTAAIVLLALRRERLLAGKVAPRPAREAGLCRACAFRQTCAWPGR